MVSGNLTLGSVNISLAALITIVVSVVAMIALTFLVQRTKLGKAMRAVSEDMGAAQLMGINLNRTISFTFAVGSALAGIGSVLYLCAYPQASPTMGSMLGLKAFVAAVLGGIGSIPRCDDRRLRHRPGRGARLGGWPVGVEGRRGLRDPDRGAAGQADRHPGPSHDGKRCKEVRDVNSKRIPMPARYLINLLLTVLLWAALFSQIENGNISRYWSGILVTVGINIILAVSLNMATGYLGQLPLGHAGFMAVGAYTGGIFMKATPLADLLKAGDTMGCLPYILVALLISG